MELEQVRELVKLVEDSGIDELEITQKDLTIRIQKSRPHPAVSGIGGLASNPQPLPVQGAIPSASMTTSSAEALAPAAEQERARWKEIRSPIVGTFYKAPAPGADPFIRVGDRISSGQTLCIIEAMKVMNEIEAEISGVIKEVLVEDAMPVEAEAVLFLVDPA